MIPDETLLFNLWGKYHRPTAERPAHFHAAVLHMLDVGLVARALMPVWAARFARLLGCSRADAARWVAFLVAAHDVGKLTPGFQQKVADVSREAALAAAGLPLIRPELKGSLVTGFDHGLQGVIALRRWAESGAVRIVTPPGCPVEAREISRAGAIAVGAHHGSFHSSRAIQKHRDRYRHYDDRGWGAVQDLALEWLARALLGEGRTLDCAPPNLSALILTLAGFTSVCDWIGSSADDFPMTGDRITPRAYPGHAWEAALRAVRRRGMVDPERLRTAGSYDRLFPDKLPPRPVQRAVIALAGRGHDRPGLLIVEAPMGEGKTEAALAWAAAAQSDACRGVYFALPTQATSDAMFDRVRKVLVDLDPGGPEPGLWLLHGAASLSQPVVLGRVTPNRSDDPGDRVEALRAEGWFAPRKRTLWATYGVGTVDQALLAALWVRHGAVRLTGLAGKVVIVDEVHAYDVYISSLLERLLRWLSALGTPVVLLSATLPARRRRRLIEAYGGVPRGEPGPMAYPLVCHASPSGAVEWAEPAQSDRRSRVALERGEDPGDEPARQERLAAEIWAMGGDGGCIAWIHNTVGGAQQAFLALRRIAEARTDPGVELMLFHARFPARDRRRIEAAVVGRFGKDGSRPARAILVATQVVEQSLDLDFDFLVTQLAPADLLLQRIGRLHRHAGTPRPAAMASPRVLVLEPPRAGRSPRFDATGLIYSRFVLLKTIMALSGRSEVRLPDDIRGLVEAVYDDQIPDASAAESAGLDPREFASCWAELEREREHDEEEARNRLLGPPDPISPFTDSAHIEFDDRDEASAGWIAAKTRLGPEGRAVALLHGRGGATYLDADGGRPIDLDRPLSPADQREVLLRSVALSDPGLVGHLRGLTTPRGIGVSAALRHHAVLALDRGRYPLPDGRLVVRLDPALGVAYERPRRG